MFLSTLRTHRITGIITLIPTIVSLLRVILLLALTQSISFSLIPPKLLGILAGITSLAF